MRERREVAGRGFWMALLIGAAIVGTLISCPRAHAQEPSPIPSPSATPEPDPTYIYDSYVDAGPVNVSTPEEGLKVYGYVAATIEAKPWDGWTFTASAKVYRESNGDALSIQDFLSLPAAGGEITARYRVSDSPVSIGARLGGSWTRGTLAAFYKDPKFWTAVGEVCLEKWKYFPKGGTLCGGAGLIGPVGGGGASVRAMYPVSTDKVWVYAKADVAFVRLPEVIRALPTAVAGAPITTPPTPEQILAVGQQLPVRIETGIIARPFGKLFGRK